MELLEEMDKTYVKSKAILDKSGKVIATLETLKTEVKTLKRQIEDIQLKMMRAKEDGKLSEIKPLEASLKAPKANLALKKEQLQKLEAVVRQSQISVGKRMTEISKIPELRAHLKDVIEKKFSRQLTQFQKQKEEKLKQNEPLIRIQKVAQKDSKVMYILAEIEKYAKLENELQTAIANSTKSEDEKKKDQNYLVGIQSLLSKSRGKLAKYFKGTITRDVIDQITSYENLGRQIKSNNKYISGLDKQIANYTTALENIGLLTPCRVVQLEPQPEPQPDNLPAKQPKWYQFATRLKNWVNQFKSYVQTEQQESQPQLEPGSEPYESNPTPKIEPISISEEQKNQFKDSMKYDIVKDYEEKLAASLLKQAKSQNRKTPDMDRDD